MNVLTFSKRINFCKKYEDLIRLLSCIRKCDKIVFIRRKLNFYSFSHAFFWILGLWTVSAATGSSQLSRNFFLMHLMARFRGLVRAQWPCQLPLRVLFHVGAKCKSENEQPITERVKEEWNLKLFCYRQKNINVLLSCIFIPGACSNWRSTLRSKSFHHRMKRVSCYVANVGLFSSYDGSICFVMYFTISDTVKSGLFFSKLIHCTIVLVAQSFNCPKNHEKHEGIIRRPNCHGKLFRIGQEQRHGKCPACELEVVERSAQVHSCPLLTHGKLCEWDELVKLIQAREVMQPGTRHDIAKKSIYYITCDLQNL